MIEAIHCGACAHADDGGIIGNRCTCALDAIDRPRHADCAHGPDGFVEDMRSMAQRYPGYDAKQFGRSHYVMHVLPWQAVAKGQAKVLNLGGVIAVVSAHVPLVTNNPQEYETPGAE